MEATWNHDVGKSGNMTANVGRQKRELGIDVDLFWEEMVQNLGNIWKNPGWHAISIVILHDFQSDSGTAIKSRDS